VGEEFKEFKVSERIPWSVPGFLRRPAPCGTRKDKSRGPTEIWGISGMPSVSRNYRIYGISFHLSPVCFYLAQ
jgi:hypothetical protein